MRQTTRISLRRSSRRSVNSCDIAEIEAQLGELKAAALAGAWPAKPIGVAQPATRRRQARTLPVRAACSRAISCGLIATLTAPVSPPVSLSHCLTVAAWFRGHGSLVGGPARLRSDAPIIKIYSAYVSWINMLRARRWRGRSSFGASVRPARPSGRQPPDAQVGPAALRPGPRTSSTGGGPTCDVQRRAAGQNPVERSVPAMVEVSSRGRRGRSWCTARRCDGQGADRRHGTLWPLVRRRPAQRAPRVCR